MIVTYIESHDMEGVTWWVSFTGSNPQIEDCFQVATEEDAKKACILINRKEDA